jgi:ATP-binding protein involved in chromosome partitioning
MTDVNKAIEAISKELEPGAFKDVSVRDKKVIFNLMLENPGDTRAKEVLIKKVEACIKEAGFKELDVYTTQRPPEGHRPIGGTSNRGTIAPRSPIEGIKNIIAINSGKGGVGKTTCSVNIAIALGQLGYKVGLLDADITGPNVHLMLGVKDKPQMTEDKRVASLEAYGIKLISMGTLVDEDKPTIWRGPMLDGVIKQFLREVAWGELDYLVIDLPPGTSDAQLTLCQNVPLSGVVTITTPQDVALLDARKGLMMFQKMNVPMLGIIENMSFFECPHCHERTEIFSHGGGAKASQELGVDFLGAIPIELKVRTGGDTGKPITAVDREHSISQAFMTIAEKIVVKVKEPALNS